MTKPLDPLGGRGYPLGSGAGRGPDTRPMSEQRSGPDGTSSHRQDRPGLFPPSTFIYPLRCGNIWMRHPGVLSDIVVEARGDALARRMDWAALSRRSSALALMRDAAAWRGFGA